MWARNLFKKIFDPMQVLKTKLCVIQHKNAQLCVNFYNYLTSVLLHYEMVHHKAWYDFAEEVRNKLELPILKKNPVTNKYEINLHGSIYQVIRETECMLKMDLAVPEIASTLTYCKIRIETAYERIKELVQINNKLRESIPLVLINILRPQLRRLSQAFEPSLSYITWTSQNIDEYFDELNYVINDVSIFLKKITDIKDARIEKTLKMIAQTNLVCLPKEPLTPTKLVDVNNELRTSAMKKLDIQSQSIELAVVEMVIRFVDAIKVKEFDERGNRRYQLPLAQQSDRNWRSELLIPIDKYDWISFEKITRTILLPSEEVRESLCFKDYDKLYYQLPQLHSDCMDLFSYFNAQLISAMVKCTKTSLETLKRRSNLAKLVILRLLYNPRIIIHFIQTAFNSHPRTLITRNHYSRRTWNWISQNAT